MNGISVNFTKAEALVLFEWLARNDDSGALAITRSAEQTVRWNLEAQLERQIDEIFSPAYGEILEKSYLELENSN
jgi:hypothetical protein